MNIIISAPQCGARCAKLASLQVLLKKGLLSESKKASGYLIPITLCRIIIL